MSGKILLFAMIVSTFFSGGRKAKKDHEETYTGMEKDAERARAGLDALLGGGG